MFPRAVVAAASAKPFAGTKPNERQPVGTTTKQRMETEPPPPATMTVATTSAICGSKNTRQLRG
jgi:hypothetical protein